MSFIKYIVLFSVALIISVESSGLAPAPAVAASPLVASAHVGYAHAVPQNIPPYAAQVNLFNRAVSSPFYAAHLAAPISAPLAAPIAAPFAAPIAAPFAASFAAPLSAVASVPTAYAASPYAVPGPFAYAPGAAPLLRTPFGYAPTFLR